MFEKDKYNFWKEENPREIEYTEEYKRVQKTTPQMSWLRLGCLIAVLNENVNTLKNWSVCDVGSGNGCFIKEVGKVFGKACNYDLCGETITKEQLLSTIWDVIFLTDVLQHFKDINELFDIKYKYLFLSFPQCPPVDNWEQLKTWRHYRPGEHLYMLNAKGMKEWLKEHNHTLLHQSNLQDAIRKSPYNVNITTQIYKRELL